jgi:hypothetical protein
MKPGPFYVRLTYSKTSGEWLMILVFENDRMHEELAPTSS